MTIASFSEQILTFVIGLGMGVIICLLYDVFRIIRLGRRCGRISIFVQDMAFWVISALLTFFLLMARCEGELRIYVFMAEIIGFIICRVTISRLIMKISDIIVRFFKRIIRFIGRKFWRPIRAFANKAGIKISIKMRSLLSNILNIVNKAKKGLKERSALLYNQHKIKKNDEDAAQSEDL